jgi:radical SAM protein with 4Fe4S-binding SPASM domain
VHGYLLHKTKLIDIFHIPIWNKTMLQKIRYQIYRAKYVYGRKLNHKTPVDVSVELASYCTNKCGYCYHADKKNMPFKQGFMEKSLAFKIINEAAELGVHSLKTNYRGESTMNPDFERITAHAKSLADGSTFLDRITNSNFNFALDREDLFRGLCNQTKVKVSFDSFRKEIFEQQRKGSYYEKTLANIDKFYNYSGRDNELIIQAVRTNLNADEDLLSEIKKRWPSASGSVRDCVEGRVEKDLSETVVRRRNVSDRQSCIQAHVRLMIHWDGSVGACCPDIAGKIKLGNAKDKHLRDLFNSTEAQQLRKDLKSGAAFTTNPCKGCSSFESYKGFKANWNS